MTNQQVTIEEQNPINHFIQATDFGDPNDKDTPKPEGSDSGSGEGEDEDEKPGENIFK